MSKLYCQSLLILQFCRAGHVTNVVKECNLSKLKKTGNKMGSKWDIFSSLEDKEIILLIFHILFFHLIFVEYLLFVKD